MGLQLARAAKTVGMEFDKALAQEGGTVPMWQVLLTLKTRQSGSQRQLAAAVGIRGATLTHHLNAMAAQGLVTRERDPENRRVHQLALTEAGEDAFARLRVAAVAFDERLRAGIPERDFKALDVVLSRIVANATAGAG